MEINKLWNEREKCFDFELREENKILRIFFAGNLDLYMTLGDGEPIPENTEEKIVFEITKENYEIYSYFEALYHDIISGKVFEEDIFLEDIPSFDYKKTYEYQKLVDQEQKIHWISDDGPSDLEDQLVIQKGEDKYQLIFIRNEKPLDYGFKSSYNITIRFRNSGSQYSPFNCVFMRLYQQLQNIETDYHQIHFEEIEYQKKKEKKRTL